MMRKFDKNGACFFFVFFVEMEGIDCCLDLSLKMGKDFRIFMFYFGIERIWEEVEILEIKMIVTICKGFC